MDQFVTISKPSSLRVEKDKKPTTLKYNPYSSSKSAEEKVPVRERKRRTVNLLGQLPKDSTISSSALTKYLLSTLSDESNPITHSDIGGRAEYVTSTSTGHEVAENHRHRSGYLKSRAQKLANQTAEDAMAEEPKVLRNVRVYINGFLNDTTDIEMKRIVIRAGGQIVGSAAGATHILTSQQLSGSKTHKILTTKSRNLVHVVAPEWVIDSIKAGKRRPEREYSVIKNTTTKNLFDMFQR